MRDHSKGNMLEFKAGCSHLISGQSGSGKSRFIYKILKNKDVMFGQDEPKAIRYYYGIWQSLYDKMKEEIDGITFHQNLPTEEEVLEFTSSDQHTVIVIDDLQDQACNSSVVELLFTRISHHRHCTCFYLLQNAFIQGSKQITIGLNAQYICIHRSPRSIGQLNLINRQIFTNSKHILADAYSDVMKRDNFGYILIDLTPHCPDELRIRTRIFPGEQTIVYRPD